MTMDGGGGGGGSVLTVENFSSIYPFIYFNLERQKTDVRDGTTKLTFHYEFSSVTNANYIIFALVLYKRQIKLVKSSGKLILC